MVLHDFVYVRVMPIRVPQAQEHTKHTAQHIYFFGGGSNRPATCLFYASHLLLLLRIIIIVITNWKENKGTFIKKSFPFVCYADMHESFRLGWMLIGPQFHWDAFNANDS